MPKYTSLMDVSTILNDYSLDIQEAITKDAEEVSQSARDELKLVSPKRTGEYAKGWRVTTKKNRGSVECVVHNKKYQLTHLLERPHAKRGGGSTTPKVHIKPVEEKSVKQFEQDVERIIKNGG